MNEEAVNKATQTTVDIVRVLPAFIAIALVMYVLSLFVSEKFSIWFMGILLLSMVVLNADPITRTIRKFTL